MDSDHGAQPWAARKDLKDRPGPGKRMDSSQSNRSLYSPENSSRSSFSSVRENDSDLAQAFTSTKVSSYSRPLEEALEDDELSSPPAEMSATATQFMPPVTQPQSRLHGCWYPAVAADSFKGWKQIDVKGKIASRSFGDLQSLKIVWTPPAAPPPQRKGSVSRDQPGQAPIEKLPIELLGKFPPTLYPTSAA